MSAPPRWARATFLVVAHLLFWSWNLSTAAIAWFGLGPEVLYALSLAALAGVTPASYFWLSVVLFAGPPVALVCGLLFRRDPGRMLSLFFGVEIPVLVLALVRLFALQELNPAVSVLLGSFSVGAVGLTVVVLNGARFRSRWGSAALVAALSMFVVPAFWLAGVDVLVGFPVVARLLGDGARHLYSFRDFFGLVFAFASMAVVVGLPLAMVAIGLRALGLTLAAGEERWGRRPARVLSGTVMGGTLLALVAGADSPVEEAWALSEDPVAAIEQADLVRDGLLDAYLWEVRYLDHAALADDIGELWDREFIDGVKPWVAPVARFWLDPVLFDGTGEAAGVRRWGNGRAADRFMAVFDQPIERAEPERIRHALSYTWEWWRAEARVVDVGAEHVWLASQDVTVDETDGVAVVTVHDVYRNRTFSNREVVVYFNLPEEAVVTGLWLSDSPDRADAFTHVVAPRGAAQQVYQEQVRRSIDPALLERVGPRQYRLRAFPVLAREGDARDIANLGSLGAEFHMWMEVTVLPERQVDGTWTWPVPTVSERRGVFWNDDTERTVNGAHVGPTDRWVPEVGPVRGTVEALDVVVADPDGEAGWQVHFTPQWQDVGTTRVHPPPVVLVDTTASMRHVREALVTALDDIPRDHLYCAYPSAVARCPDAHPRDWTLAGSAPLPDLLAHLDEVPELSAASGLIFLTDRTTYDTARDGADLSVHMPRLALVHLDGLPIAYTDTVLDALANNGGAFTSVHAAMRHLAGLPTGGWTRQVTETTAMGVGRSSAHAVAASAVVAHEAAGARDLSQLASLDRLHRLAVSYDIVTPVSSMIVLVNRAQKERLQQLENGKDRFEREHADDRNLSRGFALSSAPEPGTWVLMGLAAAGLVGGRRRRLTRSGQECDER